MTQVRSILPDRLKRARFTTVAKDPSYRRYFAAGDDSAAIRTVLTHLYEAGGNARKLRDLERQARSRRSHNAAAHRRQTQQHVAHERDLWQEMVARERRQARTTGEISGEERGGSCQTPTQVRVSSKPPRRTAILQRSSRRGALHLSGRTVDCQI